MNKKNSRINKINSLSSGYKQYILGLADIVELSTTPEPNKLFTCQNSSCKSIDCSPYYIHGSSITGLERYLCKDCGKDLYDTKKKSLMEYCLTLEEIDEIDTKVYLGPPTDANKNVVVSFIRKNDGDLRSRITNHIKLNNLGTDYIPVPVVMVTGCKHHGYEFSISLCDVTKVNRFKDSVQSITTDWKDEQKLQYLFIDKEYTMLCSLKSNKKSDVC